MKTVRCVICRQQLPTLKSLTTHYLNSHSKLGIIKQLLKTSILQATPNLIKNKNRKPKSVKTIINNKFCDSSSKTIYLHDNIHILCSPNEIIIGDEKSVDMEFTFDENSNESKENYYLPLRNNSNPQTVPKKTQLNTSQKENSSAGSSRFNPPRRMKRKKEPLKHYRINITKVTDADKKPINKSLDDETGKFYTCICRDIKHLVYPCKNVTSDTESSSDTTTPPGFKSNKIFCENCGSGYKTHLELVEHMKNHEPFCHICKLMFASEEALRSHIRSHLFKIYVCHVCRCEFSFEHLLQSHFQSHLEEDLVEMVLDMEEDYKIERYNFGHVGYGKSINSLLCFLSDTQDFPFPFYNYKFTKIFCDICYKEVFLSDFERHLQTTHFPYG